MKLNELNSPVGRRRFAEMGAAEKQELPFKSVPKRILTVPNEEQFVSQPPVIMEAEASSFESEDEAFIDYREDKEALAKLVTKAKVKQEPISPKSKSKLEVLLGIKRSQKDVTINGVTYSLQSLKKKELREILIQMADETPKSEALLSFDFRDQTLARSLFAINGKDLAYVLGGSGPSSVLALLDEMREEEVSKLWEVYSELKQDLVIDSPKEVIEEIKK